MAFTEGALTGAFLDVTVVEDYGETEEEETVIGQTTEDIELERDSEEAEFQIHNDGTLKRIELATALDLTFNLILTNDRENLENTGMLDDEGFVQRNTPHEAMRLVVYEHPDGEPGEEDPDTVVEFTDVVFKLETIEMPIDDVATVEPMVWVNGDVRFRDPADVYPLGGE